MNEFNLIHKYNTMVRREQAEPLTCSRCENELVTKNVDGLSLYCYECQSNTRPGGKMLQDIKEKVEEYFYHGTV